MVLIYQRLQLRQTLDDLFAPIVKKVSHGYVLARRLRMQRRRYMTQSGRFT